MVLPLLSGLLHALIERMIVMKEIQKPEACIHVEEDDVRDLRRIISVGMVALGRGPVTFLSENL